MGLSFNTMLKLLGAATIVTIFVAFVTRDPYNTAWTAIALTSLIGFIWAVSTRETTFNQLGINTQGILNVFAFIVVTALFAEWCLNMWSGAPRIGVYILSLVTVGIFWWAIEMMEPTVSSDIQ